MVASLKLKEAEDTGQYSSLPLVYFPSLGFAGEQSDFVSIFHHPRVVEAEVTEQDSLFLTRDFLATAMVNRGLFDLNDEYMKLIMHMDAESHLLIEKGFYIGLLRKYFIFCICETVDKDEYTFSSRDSYSNSQAVMLSISLTGNKSHGWTFKSTADVTLNQLRSSSFKMLGELMSILDKMPDEPQDYKPPFFSGCLENEAQYLLAENPLWVEVGNVNSKRLVLTLKISRSQGTYLELTFAHLSLALSEDIMDQLETEVVISETGKDTYVKNRDKGKSVLDENDFMKDDGKHTRCVTKNARCKFFAEGFCPFGDECWFSHHVGGDGNVFSCEASGSDSKISRSQGNYLEPTDVFSNFPHLSLTRDFLANRGLLFYLNDEYMKLIMPMDAEAHRLIEKDFYIGLLRKYFIFCTCETVDEEYTFSSRNSYSNSQAVMLSISLTENKSHGGTFKSTADVTLNQLRSSSFKMLGELMSILDKMPDEPQDYKPPFFSGCLENEAQYLLAENPLWVEVGNVNSKRLVLTLKISRSQGSCLELTFPHLSLALSEDIMDQLETEVVISETGKDTYVKNRDKGKSVLDENDFMKDDGKHTRCVTKNARCKFFAEGFCPFGDECWFSHHVGGDGNVFSCEASGSDSKISRSQGNYLEPTDVFSNFPHLSLTRDFLANRGLLFYGNVFSEAGRCCWDISISKLFRKAESSLAGVKKNILETAKERVRAYQNHALTPSDLKRIFGPKLYDVCCAKEEPPSIACWFETSETEEAGNSSYESQLLSWRSAKRSPNWRAGVTRVDRKWVTLSEEEKKKVGPIRNEQEEKVLGAVRDQGPHQLCWAYVAVNTSSSGRVIAGKDKEFVTLSVKELCFFASPQDRLLQETSTGHKCHPLQVSAGLIYIKNKGVTEERGDDRFDCIKDKPKSNGKKKIHIEDYVYLGNDLYAALKRLEEQPIGATVVLFSEYWDTPDGEIYRGPQSDESEYEGLHGMTVADAFLIEGELVFWCKSSHGTEYHDNGYIQVSGEMMVMGHHFAAGSGKSTLGVNRGERGDTPFHLSSPKALIHDFVYPVVESKKRKR